MPVTEATASPFELLQLLADPVRWQLLDELARSDRRVSELCALGDKPQSLVSYHLRELRSGGLVTSRRSAADGRDTYYRGDLGRCADVLAAVGGSLHPAIDLAATEPRPVAGRRGPRQRVLFLCTGNSARSQMAEALLEQMSRGAIVGRSAGSTPKPLNPLAVRVLAERGIDISGRRSKHLDRFAGDRFDRVVTLCDKVREVCPRFGGNPTTAHWSMADPAAEGDDDEARYRAFVRTAHEIEQRLGWLIAELAAESRDEGKKR
jgi:protein-tyrosine-phosphatase/DNA-binding transcriptional ArsR family regulator